MLATMTRTDAHRPSAIQPDDYRFVACDYYGGGFDGQAFTYDRLRFRSDMERTGGTYARHSHGGTCHICGASALYVAKFHHAKTNTYIVTGMDCADKMDMGDAAAFRAFRKNVQAERKAHAGKRKAREIMTSIGFGYALDVWERWANQASDVASFTRGEQIIGEIVGKLARYGSISQPQWNLIEKITGDRIVNEQRAHDRAAAAAIAPVSQYVGNVGERRDFAVTINFVASFETQFGYTHIHGCTDAAGNAITYKGSAILGKKGEAIRFKATIKAHQEYKGVSQTIVARPKLAEPALDV